jgi:hypothetical protein
LKRRKAVSSVATIVQRYRAATAWHREIDWHHALMTPAEMDAGLDDGSITFALTT